MTVTYTMDVSSGDFFVFSKLLLRWHGSVWKNVHRELIVWLICYAVFSALYRFVLINLPERSLFEQLVLWGSKRSEIVPLDFLLGFFVTLVIRRWWEMFNYFGWIDNVGLYIGHYIEGDDDHSRLIRRTVLRYVALVQALVMRDMSPVVKRRFPNDQAFVESGFMSAEEQKALAAVVSPHGKYWLPVHWSFNIMKKARNDGIIKTDRGLELVFDRIREYRTGLAKLRGMHWVPVPLAYTHVVFLVVRCFLALLIIGRQHIFNKKHGKVSGEIDLFVPIVSILQFIFYLGWLKVAEALLNPFGDDDDDFECNWFIDRNLQMGLSSVDDCIGKEPPMEKDVFWTEVNPEPLYSFGAQNTPLWKQNASLFERTMKRWSTAIQAKIFRRRLIVADVITNDLEKVEESKEIIGKGLFSKSAPQLIPNSSDHRMYQRYGSRQSLRRKASKIMPTTAVAFPPTETSRQQSFKATNSGDDNKETPDMKIFFLSQAD